MGDDVESHCSVSNYNDRAQDRRQKVGSDNPYEKTESASLETSIDSRNKGFNMLAKMGWKEGEGLGKSASGIAEPVGIEQRSERAGLGAQELPVPPKADPRPK
ncbi:Angiogenic factor with G patch and FHA domains 1like [Caligus rogercresseyi]|uniref:Angiogenic factor with G patch and FHA domains 1like n=1 Tax=Caligus rogercresseyi TaxID=217165 RepID=A0A7T8KJQ2_CALRO|nr:Angiogenic factor with G patch and FHA domains 1like [Caligus rogercresseyi]